MNMKDLREVLLALAGFCLVMAAVEYAQAHNGGMAADGCHKDNAVGERHWHVEDSIERGGECIEVDGETVQLRTIDFNKCLMHVEYVEDALRNQEHIDSAIEIELAEVLKEGCL